MELKITTLIENMSGRDERLKYEHGLSLFIEFDGRKILFDTGQTGAYLDNARLMGIAVKDVDTMIISHGHYDHSGGVMNTMDLLRQGTMMYVGQEFFDGKYKVLEDGSFQYNGISFSERDILERQIKLVKVKDDVTLLSGNIMLFKNFVSGNDFEKRNPKFMVKKDEKMFPDDFVDEIVLGLITSKGLVVVAGCSHVGIINILSNIKERVNIPIYGVLGGTHLVEADESRIDKTLHSFQEMHIEYIAVSHCTGENGIKKIRDGFKERFILNCTGNVFTL